MTTVSKLFVVSAIVGLLPFWLVIVEGQSRRRERRWREKNGG